MNETNNLPCKECGKPVPQTKGKRTKEFCSVTCRSNNWQKRQRLLAASVPLPSDYVNFKKIGILSPDGSVEAFAKGKQAKLQKHVFATLNQLSEDGNKAIPAPQAEKPAEPSQKKEEVVKEAENEYMGVLIPEGLTGLPLAVWKNNVKVKAKAAKKELK